MLDLVNSHTAEVSEARKERVSLRLEDVRCVDLAPDSPQLRRIDHAWASTMHASQGRTVDNVIAVMESGHKNLTTQKSFHVEISRARDRAELVTDNAKALKEQLEAATGERMAALEGIGEPDRGAPEKQQKALHVGGRETELGKDRDSGMSTDARQSPEFEPDRSKNRGRNMGFGL